MGSGVGGLGEKGEGIRKYKLVVTNSPGGGKYSTGNIVSNIVTTVYSARGMLEIGGLCKVYGFLTTMLYT